MSDGTKADDIALALEEAIVSGEIPPGSTLRQEHLSEQFQVSRTPVREALRRLAALGLVTFEPNRGVRVRLLSRDEIREAFMVRAELEGLATEIATPKMTDDDLAELERAERRFSRATRALVEMSHDGRQELEVARDWLHLNHSFHDVIYRAADVPLDRADGEGGAAHVPREARVGDRCRPRRALSQERSPAPRDPGRNCRPQPGGRARPRARTRALVRAPARGHPGQGLGGVTGTDARALASDAVTCDATAGRRA